MTLARVWLLCQGNSLPQVEFVLELPLRNTALEFNACHCYNTTLVVFYYTRHFSLHSFTTLYSVQYLPFKTEANVSHTVYWIYQCKWPSLLTVHITLMIYRSPEAIQRPNLGHQIVNLFQRSPITWTINPANQNTKLTNHFYQRDPQHHQGGFHQNVPRCNTRGGLTW